MQVHREQWHSLAISLSQTEDSSDEPADCTSASSCARNTATSRMQYHHLALDLDTNSTGQHLREHKNMRNKSSQTKPRGRKSLVPTAPSESKKLLRMALLLLVVPLVMAFVSPIYASPPVDFFIYTSQQPAAAREGAPATRMPTIESIYGSRASTSQDAALAQRVLDLVSNGSHSHDNDQVDLELTRVAWNLMEKQAKLYMQQRILVMRPLLSQLIKEAEVSADCEKSIHLLLEDLSDLRQWATLMWNSWGSFPPAGIYEGSFTDLGSYRGCMSIEDRPSIGQEQYCMLDYQPIVPTRPRFHSIFKRILGHSGEQLNYGDFQSGAKMVSGSLKISSKDTSHEFPSTRFNKLVSMWESSNGKPNNNRYNKRTIDQNTTQTAQSANSSSIIDMMTTTSLATNASTTLSAEALIELAQKAQYFYYVKFRLGACMPSKCSLRDIKSLARTAGRRAILQVTEVNCMKKEPFSMNSYQLVAIWILSALALIAVLGTIVDILGLKRASYCLVDWLLPFSIWTNSKRLFDLDTAGTHVDLECVHGLRFFSMLWVIYGHTILYMEYQSFTHFYDVVETKIPSFLLLPSLNANFSVDTFFVISGILTTYVTYEYTHGDPRKFNRFAFLISRYIRLTPQLAIVILCFFLLPLFGDGPMYRYVANDKAEVCYKNWLINLLYLQSYINSEKLCIDPSWWLSIEMSFHVISVVILVVMIRNARQGLIVNFVIAAALTIWGAIIHYQNGFAIQYLPSIPQRFEVSLEQTKLFFHRPYPHAASYFIGIALGYVLANKTIKKLSTVQIVHGWLVCAFGFTDSLWGSYYWNLGAPYTQIQATLYYNLCQILWPVSIAWIILACSLGYGGCVSSILSAKCFVPLGRITYMTYLSHALIIYYHSASMAIPVEPSMLLFTYLFIANTTLALALGVVLTVVYESPILNLQKKLFTYLTMKFDPTVRGPRPVIGNGAPAFNNYSHKPIQSTGDEETFQQGILTGGDMKMANGKSANIVGIECDSSNALLPKIHNDKTGINGINLKISIKQDETANG